jgi:uncharacterized membrane protein
MGFFLSNSIFLWGLAGSLIPLVLHLERRRSARTVPFTMLRFLREVERRRFLNLRILELLLLFLRMAIIALIAIALAGPTLTFPEGAPLWALLLTSRSEHRDTVILLDTSYSMRASSVGRSPWEEANRTLLATARRPRTLPTLSVYPFSDGLDRPAPTLPPAPLPPDLAKGLERLQPVGERTNVGKALVGLQHQVGSLEGREVVVVTDLQRNGWDSLLRGTVTLPQNLRLTVVDASERDLPNVWVERLEPPPLPWAYGEEEVLRFTIRNSAFDPGLSLGADVTLYGVGNALIQKQSVFITPGVNLLLEWGLRAAPPDGFSGRIDLQPNDATEDSLLTDNQLEFQFPILSGQRALIVGGTDTLTRLSLSIALSPSDEEDEEEYYLRASHVESLAALPSDLGEYSFIVLVMTRAEPYPEEAIIALEEFVGNGGGLLLIPSQAPLPSVDDGQSGIAVVNDTLEHFGVKVYGARDSPEPLSLTWIDETHAIFASLADLPPSALASVHIYSWFAFGGDLSVVAAASESSRQSDREVPILVERSFGSGTVLCFATGLDAVSSDLAVSSFLVPLLDSISKYLSLGSRAVKTAPGATDRPESDLTRLSLADQLVLADRTDIDFLNASSLSSGIPSRALGGSLTGLFLLLALLCALVELWLANAPL